MESKKDKQKRVVYLKDSEEEKSIAAWAEQAYEELEKARSKRNTVFWYSCCNCFINRAYMHRKYHSEEGSMTWNEFKKLHSISSGKDLGTTLIQIIKKKDGGASPNFMPTFDTPHEGQTDWKAVVEHWKDRFERRMTYYDGVRLTVKAQVKLLGEMEKEKKMLKERLKVLEEDAKRMAGIIRASKIENDMKDKLEEYANLQALESSEDDDIVLKKRIPSPTKDN